MEPDKTTQTETPTPEEQRVITQKQPVTKSSATSLLLLLLVVAMAVGAGAYWWRDKQAKDNATSQQAEITALQKRVADLEKKPVEEKPATPTQTTSPSADTIANIKASIASDNTAALEGYMAASVTVIRAATGGPDNGPQTPAQAIKSLDYLKGATDPWNFELPAATLAKYRTGDYKQFFPETAVVGKSTNNYVVSFTFNSAGKINGIFMSVNSDLL